MLWTCIHYRNQKNPCPVTYTVRETCCLSHFYWEMGKCTSLMTQTRVPWREDMQHTPVPIFIIFQSGCSKKKNTPSLSQSSLWVFLLHAFLTHRSSVSPLSHSRCPFSTVQLMPLFTPGSPCAFDSINLSFESSIRANPWPLPLLQCLTSFAQIICQIDERVANDWMRRPSNRKAQSLFLTNQKPWLHSGLATP